MSNDRCTQSIEKRLNDATALGIAHGKSRRICRARAGGRPRCLAVQAVLSPPAGRDRRELGSLVSGEHDRPRATLACMRLVAATSVDIDRLRSRCQDNRGMRTAFASHRLPDGNVRYVARVCRPVALDELVIRRLADSFRLRAIPFRGSCRPPSLNQRLLVVGCSSTSWTGSALPRSLPVAGGARLRSGDAHDR
jgi:hypothetical protein